VCVCVCVCMFSHASACVNESSLSHVSKNDEREKKGKKTELKALEALLNTQCDTLARKVKHCVYFRQISTYFCVYVEGFPRYVCRSYVCVCVCLCVCVCVCVCV